jgi:hypothetical protein
MKLQVMEATAVEGVHGTRKDGVKRVEFRHENREGR